MMQDLGGKSPRSYCSAPQEIASRASPLQLPSACDRRDENTASGPLRSHRGRANRVRTKDGKFPEAPGESPLSRRFAGRSRISRDPSARVRHHGADLLLLDRRHHLGRPRWAREGTLEINDFEAKGGVAASHAKRLSRCSTSWRGIPRRGLPAVQEVHRGPDLPLLDDHVAGLPAGPQHERRQRLAGTSARTSARCVASHDLFRGAKHGDFFLYSLYFCAK